MIWNRLGKFQLPALLVGAFAFLAVLASEPAGLLAQEAETPAAEVAASSDTAAPADDAASAEAPADDAASTEDAATDDAASTEDAPAATDDSAAADDSADAAGDDAEASTDAAPAAADGADSDEPAAATDAAASTDEHAADDHADHDHAGHDHADHAHGDGHGDHGDHGGHGTPQVHPIWILPFALLLGSIAVCPLINMHFWEHHYPKFAIVLGAITAIYYMFVFDDPHAQHAWLHEMQEYVSFIALLGSLYVVSGGIMISVNKQSTPMTNSMILVVGAIIANIVGTTGAAMLLIRPFIRINKAHVKPFHIVFFIFVVANAGGCLTPIGDPPLFMGYLKGIPFFWVLEACVPMWAFVCLVTIAIFFFFDSKDQAANPRENNVVEGEPGFKITGAHNFIFILMILFAVFQDSIFKSHGVAIIWSREVLMVVALVLSKVVTNAIAPFIYAKNEFNYEPIKEVAILFIGIFSTMVPALNWLNSNADKMPLNSPGQYYFVTGGLSAVLDNAPTYLVFLATKQGDMAKNDKDRMADIAAVKAAVQAGSSEGLDENQLPVFEDLKKNHPDAVASKSVTDHQLQISMMTSHPELRLFLVAISIGAVFFGACSYIGNGPNFMVKSIAESAGIEMPSFFGYIMKYSLIYLAPLVAVYFIFIM